MLSKYRCWPLKIYISEPQHKIIILYILNFPVKVWYSMADALSPYPVILFVHSNILSLYTLGCRLVTRIHCLWLESAVCVFNDFTQCALLWETERWCNNLDQRCNHSLLLSLSPSVSLPILPSVVSGEIWSHVSVEEVHSSAMPLNQNTNTKYRLKNDWLNHFFIFYFLFFGLAGGKKIILPWHENKMFLKITCMLPCFTVYVRAVLFYCMFC